MITKPTSPPIKAEKINIIHHQLLRQGANAKTVSSKGRIDQDRVIQLIEQNGALLVLSGELNALTDWIKAVESRSQMHPWIHIIKAWVFIPTGQPERAEELLQIAEQLISSREADTGIKIM